MLARRKEFWGPRCIAPAMLKALCVLLALALHGSTFALGQEVATAEPETAEDFKETFDQSAPVSGGIVVGLRLGDAVGKLDPGDVRFVSTQQTLVCVRALTRDGRFFSNNKYAVTNQQTAASVRLQPVTREHKSELAGYNGSDYALKVFEARGVDCLPTDALHLPQMTSGPNLDTLTIMINASSRKVSLEAPVGARDIRCGYPPGGARIAFDQECSVNIAGIREGDARFTIAMDDGFATEKEVLLVSLKQPRR